MSIEGTESVHWQIKSEDKEWINLMVKETGANICDIFHQLVEAFKENSKEN